MKLFDILSKSAGALMPNCKEASRWQSEALDSDLPFLRRFGLRIHLLFCKWCRRYGKQIKFLRAAAHDCSKEEHLASPQKLSEEARERIKRKLLSPKS